MKKLDPALERDMLAPIVTAPPSKTVKIRSPVLATLLVIPALMTIFPPAAAVTVRVKLEVAVNPVLNVIFPSSVPVGSEVVMVTFPAVHALTSVVVLRFAGVPVGVKGEVGPPGLVLTAEEIV